MDRLGPHPDDDKSLSEMTADEKEALKYREVGRRVWSALTSQDWLCSTSQGMYTLQKRHYTSILPRDLNEETLEPLEDDLTPTCTALGSYLNRVAYVIVCYLDDMADAPDLQAKYNVVLRYDTTMRAVTSEKMPKWLLPHIPWNPSWPRWASWARRGYSASSAHKIIMLHQNFFGKSFKDSRFTYSRWACTTGAKQIIEAMKDRDKDEPQWWVEQVC